MNEQSGNTGYVSVLTKGMSYASLDAFAGCRRVPRFFGGLPNHAFARDLRLRRGQSLPGTVAVAVPRRAGRHGEGPRAADQVAGREEEGFVSAARFRFRRAAREKIPGTPAGEVLRTCGVTPQVRSTSPAGLETPYFFSAVCSFLAYSAKCWASSLHERTQWRIIPSLTPASQSRLHSRAVYSMSLPL